MKLFPILGNGLEKMEIFKKSLILMKYRQIQLVREMAEKSTADSCSIPGSLCYICPFSSSNNGMGLTCSTYRFYRFNTKDRILAAKLWLACYDNIDHGKYLLDMGE
jgi:hypothetical protein